MRPEYLAIAALPAWAKLNGVTLTGVEFRRFHADDDDGTDKGCAVVATEERHNGDLESEDSHPETLVNVPSEMVLSLESVGNYAKSDRYLREVLEAVGGFGRVRDQVFCLYMETPLICTDSQRGDIDLSSCPNHLLYS